MHGYAQYLKKPVDLDMETNGKSCCMKYNKNSCGKSVAFLFSCVLMNNMKKVLYQFILFTSLQYVYRLLCYVHKSHGIVINIVLIFYPVQSELL